MILPLAIFAISIILAAVAVARLLWRTPSESACGWEKAASVAVLAFAFAIAASWTLSWLGLLSRGPLLLLGLLLAAPAVIALRSGVATAFSRRDEVIDPWMVAVLSPLIVWLVFVAWRAALVPPLSHDALAYHLPKALMIERAHHFDFFPAPDPRISTSPANYELLLADVIALTGSDDLTEWVGTAAYIAFLLLAAGLVARWWGTGPHVVATVLLLAGVPVVLLHAGAHKNDLMANVFYLGAAFWGSRWLSDRSRAALVLGLVSLACAGGTKLQAVFVAVPLVAVLAWLITARRLRLTRAEVLIIAAAIPAAVFLFGGWAYIANYLHAGMIAIPASESSNAGYGDWRNLWEVPALILLRPFDRGVIDLLVPWRGERWYWPRYELYFSDFGAVVALLLLTTPFAVARYRRRAAPRASPSELGLTSLVMVAAFALMLPIRIRPTGFFAGFPRYFAFVAVLVLAWTVAPFVRRLWMSGHTRATRAMLVLSSLVFVVYTALYTWRDAFQPLAYVAYVREHPETRRPYFSGYRAATYADAVASDDASIAVHGGFETWLYPLYGAKLRRKVVFIQPGDPIPADVQWVVVDRSWNVIWGHPDFKNTGQHAKYLARGLATAEDVAVIRHLATHPEWQLVYLVGGANQAVFMRRPGGSRR